MIHGEGDATGFAKALSVPDGVSFYRSLSDFWSTLLLLLFDQDSENQFDYPARLERLDLCCLHYIRRAGRIAEGQMP